MTTQNEPQLEEVVETSEDAAVVEETAAEEKTKKKKTSSKKTKKVEQEKCYRIFVHEKQSDQDLDYVPVAVNGEVLQITKGTEVVVPQRFKEVMENAKYPVYRVKPGEDRKVTSWVRKVPFDVLGEAPYEEFEKMRDQGTKTHKKELEKSKNVEG